ncbi:MAG: ribonuclease D, partial [Desulfofustis sp.]|nr:ribonuclease D [Desulfofustis sp.]
KAWSRAPLLGLDTEFVRERTYTANLGLVQISDGHTVWLLDPLVPGSLEPLRRLLLNAAIEKIFHSPSEDLDVLLSVLGVAPEPLIDTQVACALLGKALQMGYHTAVEWSFSVKLDKEQTRSNWCARPLKKAQLHYAALDVCLLPLLWRNLREKLESKGRLDWLQEECERQLERARTPTPPGELWRRIRGAGRLDGQSLAILQALAEWRESRAQELNRPRGFIVPDPVLIAIANQRLHSRQDLLDLDGLHPRAAARHGGAICDIVTATMNSGKRLQVLPKLNSSDRHLLKAMRTKVQARASELSLDPAVLAPRRDLEEMLMTEENGFIPARLRGWRMEQITMELIDMRGKRT